MSRSETAVFLTCVQACLPLDRLCTLLGAAAMLLGARMVQVEHDASLPPPNSSNSLKQCTGNKLVT